MPRKPLTLPLADSVVHVPPRLRSNDCATWALSVVTGKPYAEVLAAVEKVDHRAGEQGLYWTQVRRIAKRLGVTLRTKRTAVLEEDAGILSVRFPDGTFHAVVLLQGPVILDADGTVWNADDYLATKGVTKGSVLVVAE